MQFLALASQVMEQRDRDGVRGFDREQSRMRCHIETAPFVSKLVTEIGSPDIREWLRDMQQKETAGSGPKRKLSRQTISRCQSLVSAVFVEAVERELIELNPCVGVRPKKRVDESDTVDKWAYLTEEEQAKLFSCEAIPLADRLMMRFAIATGLRQGEWRHLELPDLFVDDEPRVEVRIASRSRKDGSKLPPKSGKRRTVYLFGDGLAAAREWLEQLPAYAPENPEGLVFPLPTGKLRYQGKPLGKSGTVRGYYQAAGIKLRPHLHWHSLRHTCATNLVTGVYGRRWPLEEIQKVLGHSSIMITQRYAHVGEDALKRAVRETVAAIAAAAPPLSVNVPPELLPEPGLLGRMLGRARRAVEVLRAS